MLHFFGYFCSTGRLPLFKTTITWKRRFFLLFTRNFQWRSNKSLEFLFHFAKLFTLSILIDILICFWSTNTQYWLICTSKTYNVSVIVWTNLLIKIKRCRPHPNSLIQWIKIVFFVEKRLEPSQVGRVIIEKFNFNLSLALRRFRSRPSFFYRIEIFDFQIRLIRIKGKRSFNKDETCEEVLIFFFVFNFQ